MTSTQLPLSMPAATTSLQTYANSQNMTAPKTDPQNSTDSQPAATPAIAEDGLQKQNSTPSLLEFANADSDEGEGAAQQAEGVYKQYMTDGERAPTQSIAEDGLQKQKQLPAKIDEPKSKWIKLCDYGEFPHNKGLQKLTRQAAEVLVRKHRSLYARLKRYFGGSPIYVGHPDDPSFAGSVGHNDSRAYGWIHRLEARNDGLWMLPTWSNSGKRLLSEAFYKFLSPRWKVSVLPDGSFEPVELISVGLTNTPNIPGPAIANATEAEDKLAAQEDANATDALTQIAALLELPLDSAPADIVQALANALERLTSQTDSTDNNAEPTAANEARAPFFMSNTLQDYTTTRQSLRKRFVEAVEARMAETGEDFSSAWTAIKSQRREVFNHLNATLI